MCAPRSISGKLRPPGLDFVGLTIVLHLAACGGDTRKIPIESSPGETVVVARRVDGRVVVTQHEPAGEELEVEADEDRPIYTWVLSPSDFRHPDGSQVTSFELKEARFRLDDTDISSSTGQCRRCLVPSLDSPQIVNPGDSCRLPIFERGAVWYPGGDGTYQCRGATGSRVCAEGDTNDEASIEEFRRHLLIEWPGACACVPPEAPSLHDMRIEPVTPDVAPWPLSQFARRADGLIAGVGQNAVVSFVPSTGASSVTRVADFEIGWVSSVSALRSGSFLVGSRGFNTGWTNEFRYDRVVEQGGGLSAPMHIDTDLLVHPDRMKYLDGDPSYPFYILGSVRGSLGSIQPAIAACEPESLACQRVSLTQCMDETEITGIFEAEILDDGSGVAVANTGMFYKPPNGPPGVNPHPSDTWHCHQQKTAYAWRDPGSTEPPEKVRLFQSMGRVGSRLFVCGITQSERCMPDRAVVLSATVSTAAGEIPAPEWEIIYGGGDWSRCGKFLEVPGEAGQTRLYLSGSRLLDFDAQGNLVKESSVSTEYGSISGFREIRPLDPGWTLALGRENGVYVSEAGQPMQRLYGPEDLGNATYRALVATSDNEFIAFGHPAGAVRVRVLTTLDETGFPEVDARVLADPSAALKPDDVIHGAAVDTAFSRASNGWVLLVAGRRRGSDGAEPLLMRLWIDESGLTQGATVEVPSGFEGLSLLGLTEVADDTFVVISEGSRVLRVEGNNARELTVDFDDPTTENTEGSPVLSAPACGGPVPRVDTWRAIAGSHGAAWIVGRYDVVMRVVGDRVERFAVGTNADLGAIYAACPDAPSIAARGESIDLGGIVTRRVQLWQTAETRLPGPGDNAVSPTTYARGIVLEQIGEEEIETLNIWEIMSAFPRAVLPDASSRTMAPTIAVTMTNGFTHRFLSAEPIEYHHTPFDVEAVARSSAGYVLFGASESRLALGVPAR